MGWFKKIEQKARNEVKRVESDVRNEVQRTEADIRAEAARAEANTRNELQRAETLVRNTANQAVGLLDPITNNNATRTWNDVKTAAEFAAPIIQPAVLLAPGLAEQHARAGGKVVGDDYREAVGNYVLPALSTVLGTVIAPGIGTAAGAAYGRYAGGLVAGEDWRRAAEHAAGSAVISGLAGSLGEVASGGLMGAGMHSVPASMLGYGASSAAVNSAAAKVAGTDASDAAIVGAVSGGISPLTPYLGSQIDSATGLGRMSYGLAGAATGAGGYAATQGLLNNDITNVGLGMSGAMGAARGYLAAGNKPQQAKTPDANSMFDVGTAANLVGATGTSLAQYFKDKASKPYVSGAIPYITAPEWGGFLSSGATKPEDAALEQSNAYVDWKKSVIGAADNKPNLMATSDWAPVTGIIEEQAAEEKIRAKNRFNNTSFAGWQNIA